MDIDNRTFIDSGSLTKWVRYFLYLQIIVCTLSLISNHMEYQLFLDYQHGVYETQEEAVHDGEINDRRQQIVGLFCIAIFITSAILIAKWIYRANYNARQLGAKGMEFTPGWSIGWFFIPIACLWKPYEAMKEIWQASQSPCDWKDIKTGPLIPVWWMLWLVNAVAGQVMFRFSLKAEELDELLNASIINQMSDFISIPLAIVTLLMINKIYSFQVKNRYLVDIPKVDESKIYEVS